MSSPSKTHPPGVEARRVAKCSDGDRNDTNVTSLLAPIVAAALPEHQSAVDIEPIGVIDARRRAYFELRSYLRDVA